MCRERSRVSQVMKKLGCFVPICVLVAAVGCESAKSSNPLTPTVAGPIPGVDITAPRTLEPAGWKIPVDEQPVTLLAENSGSNGVRPLTYVFEVATDAGFTNKVFAREGIAPGEGGRTSVRLPDRLAPERTYFWRARAGDGANTGPFSEAAAFNVFTPIVIREPRLTAPGINAILSTNKPTFVVNNVERSGPVGSITYAVELADSENFVNRVAAWTASEQPNQTSLAVPTELTFGKVYFWHARAFDPTTMGPWSEVRAFQVAVPKAPDPVPGKPCGPPYPSDGQQIANCVMNQYPDKLVAGVSSSQRRANMEFVRDRMIESAMCGGLDVAYNLKRGGPEITADGLAWRTQGRTVFVDIGIAYDDTSIPLRLGWNAMFDLGEANWRDYPSRPSCK
jgi:hypothetical protein